VGAALSIVLLGAAIYANSFSIPFLFDDHFSIVANPDIRSLEPAGRFLTQSRGLPHLLDTLNYLWGGESVWGYHFVNVAVHLVNGLLVYALALLTLRLPIHAARYDSRAPALALLIALIFVAHPLQTMAVSYISQRAESVAAMFYLSALLVYAAGQSGRIALSGPALAMAVVAIGFLGILSKETVATLPAMVLLYHVCFLRRPADRDTADWRMALWLVLPALYGVYLARHFLLPGFADAEGGQSAWMFIPSAGLGVEGVTPWRYLITQFGVIVWYLRLLVLPTHLCFDYGWPLADSFVSVGVLAPLAALLVLAIVAVVAYPRNRWVPFGIGWMFIALAPSSSIIPIKDAAFDYRMYLPMIGPIFLMVVGAADVLRRLAPKDGAAAGVVERAGLVVAGLIIAALSVGSVARNATLADPLELARDSAAKAPNHWRTHFALGAALLEQGRGAEAIEAFERCIAISPDQSTPRIMLGDLYSRAGRLREAEDVLLPATDAREESVSAAAYRQLGLIYKAQNYSDAAIGMFEEALLRKPRWYALDLEIARLLNHAGRFHDAAVRVNKLIGDDPSYADRMGAELAQINLRGGVQSFALGETDFAKHMLGVAMEHPATLSRAAHHLAYVEARSGNVAEAVRILEDIERRELADAAMRANLERAIAGEELLAPPPIEPTP
jgi:tetratricopeptide (TPR) repeat protein